MSEITIFSYFRQILKFPGGIGWSKLNIFLRLQEFEGLSVMYLVKLQMKVFESIRDFKKVPTLGLAKRDLWGLGAES